MTLGTSEPDAQAGAVQQCECAWCREARLRDDDRIVYTARDVGQAYAAGWRDAAVALGRRLGTGLESLPHFHDHRNDTLWS